MPDFIPTPELLRLIRTLKKWSAPAPSSKLYLFGSRVRGDERQNSDVDVVIDCGADDKTVDWWTSINENRFADIDSKLPGCLHYPRDDEDLVAQVKSGPIVYEDGNVYCIWLPPK
jgi:hypothetical protein